MIRPSIREGLPRDHVLSLMWRSYSREQSMMIRRALERTLKNARNSDEGIGCHTGITNSMWTTNEVTAGPI
ncbi:hypothetical protein J6590_080121 [Homalodisca vitripennis]|nr:hypothetical protein J6590_080121 [Homalodisca vitripennis]